MLNKLYHFQKRRKMVYDDQLKQDILHAFQGFWKGPISVSLVRLHRNLLMSTRLTVLTISAYAVQVTTEYFLPLDEQRSGQEPRASSSVQKTQNDHFQFYANSMLDCSRQKDKCWRTTEEGQLGEKEGEGELTVV